MTEKMPTRARRFLSRACLILFLAAGVARGGDFQFDTGDIEWLSQKPGTAAGGELLEISLVPETAAVVAGKPFTVAVVLGHRGEGYTYWVNPGGPGKGSEFRWTLPEGFTAGSPEWPTPTVSSASGFTSYVYKGDTVVLVEIAAPKNLKPGSRVEIGLEVNTQVCTPRSCQPKTLNAAATLQAAAAAGPKNAMIEKARRSMPVRPRDWTVRAEKTAAGVDLVVTPSSGANPEPGRLYFFDRAPNQPAIDSQAGQTQRKDGDALRLSLSLPAEKGYPSALSGLLFASNGWLRDDKAVQAFAVDLPVGSARDSTVAVATYDDWMLFLFAFLGGLILNVMPCVFPVLSLKIMGFVRYSHEDHRSVLMHGIVYAAGVLVCFWALALAVITLGRGWGAQLQSPLFVLLLCYFFLVFGLNMASVFEVGTSAASLGDVVPKHQGLRTSFYTGLLTTIIATPCSAPFLGPALAYGLSLPALTALALFTVMALGLALPYVALSAAPGLLKRLPKPGPWMQTFQQAMSFPLFATSGYMLWTLGGMIDDLRLLAAIMGLTLVAFSCWMHGRFQRAAKKYRTRRLGPLLAVVALAVGLWAGWPRPEKADELEWRAWSPELVAELRAEGKPVYVDFTARWCTTCQVNKRVYYDKRVKAAMRDMGVALLKADWTLNDPRITRVLKEEFGAAAVPVTALYLPGRDKAVTLPDLLTVNNVLSALERKE